MFNRFRFFWNIAAIGAVSGIGIWWMYRRALPFLEPLWTLAFFLILPVFFTLPHVAIDHMPIKMTKISAWLGGYWFIFVFYSILVMVIYFLIYLVSTLFMASQFWALWAGRLAGLGLAVVVITLIYGTWRALHPTYRTIHIQTKKTLQKDLTIAFLTDIHFSPILSSWYSRRMVRRLNNSTADAIIFGGDMIDGNLDFVLKDGSYRNLEQLRAPLGIFAVYGNHDYFNGNLEKEGSHFRPLHFLRNQSIALTETVSLTGLDDYLHHPETEIPTPAVHTFNIIIDHEPLRLATAAQKGYDLYLAGHTHGGQFFPNTIITDRLYTLNYGYRKFAEMFAYVSSGYGFWGTPIRIGSAPEIVFFHVSFLA